MLQLSSVHDAVANGLAFSQLSTCWQTVRIVALVLLILRPVRSSVCARALYPLEGDAGMTILPGLWDVRRTPAQARGGRKAGGGSTDVDALIPTLGEATHYPPGFFLRLMRNYVSPKGGDTPGAESGRQRL